MYINYYALLKNSLDNKHLSYNEIDNGVIEVHQKGKNIPHIRIVIGFDDVNNNRPWFRCYDLGNFAEEKFAVGLMACNNANNEYRWIRFHIDNDNDVVAESDAIVSEDSVFSEVVEIIGRMITIIDEVYPSFMKARWS